MNYGLIGDIHSNLEALNEVLKQIKKEADKYICVGDVVGYGANPNECIEIVQELNCLTVVGNHDYAVVNLKAIDLFNIFAKEAILWTRKKILKKNKDILKKLKLIEINSPFTVVHATPYFPEQWYYLVNMEDAVKSFKYFNSQICLIGHSHLPFIVILDTEKESIDYIDYKEKIQKLKIEKKKRYLVNVGSVGQPRDGNPQACYFIYNMDTQEIEIKRCSYDIVTTQKKIIKAGLPQILAERLSKGQ